MRAPWGLTTLFCSAQHATQADVLTVYRAHRLPTSRGVQTRDLPSRRRSRRSRTWRSVYLSSCCACIAACHPQRACSLYMHTDAACVVCLRMCSVFMSRTEPECPVEAQLATAVQHSEVVSVPLPAEAGTDRKLLAFPPDGEFELWLLEETDGSVLEASATVDSLASETQRQLAGNQVVS